MHFNRFPILDRGVAVQRAFRASLALFRWELSTHRTPTYVPRVRARSLPRRKGCSRAVHEQRCRRRSQQLANADVVERSSRGVRRSSALADFLIRGFLPNLVASEQMFD